MGLCMCVAKWSVTRCFLEEGHEGGHRGVFTMETDDLLVVAWHGNVTDGDASDPIIVGIY